MVKTLVRSVSGSAGVWKQSALPARKQNARNRNVLKPNVLPVKKQSVLNVKDLRQKKEPA